MMDVVHLIIRVLLTKLKIRSRQGRIGSHVKTVKRMILTSCQTVYVIQSDYPLL